jgi:putative DNA primase/helicase
MNDEIDPASMDNIIRLAELAEQKTTVLITEDSAALVFAERYQGRFLYDHDAASWYRWSGYHWQQERSKLAFDWARTLVRELSEAEDLRVKIKSRKTSFVSGVERFAQTDRAFSMLNHEWNRDPFLFATPSGTVDLRTGILRPASADDRINKVAAIGPLATADCDLWYRFLDETTDRDDELIAFMQRWFGYCLTGDIREHALVFCYGPGGNGKSVMLNTVRRILGDYAKVAMMETFTATKFEQHSTDVASLAGARLVTATETEEGKFWAENKIKQMTGGDPVTARFMRCDPFTYLPTYKLTIIGNHEPNLRNVDDAMRRRLNNVLFNRKPAHIDKSLEEKLKNEWPGILRWMINGCLAWQEQGLAPPESVKAATRSYFENQDLFSQWLEEKCDVAPGKDATSTDLFASWSAYAKAAGETAGSRKTLAGSWNGAVLLLSVKVTAKFAAGVGSVRGRKPATVNCQLGRNIDEVQTHADAKLVKLLRARAKRR